MAYIYDEAHKGSFSILRIFSNTEKALGLYIWWVSSLSQLWLSEVFLQFFADNYIFKKKWMKNNCALADCFWSKENIDIKDLGTSYNSK